MKNKFIESKPLGNQSLLWRQAVTSSDNRGWNLTNIFLYFFKKYYFKYKNKPSILLDTLIVGSNPILNALLLEKIIYQSESKEKIKIGIMVNEQPDYWGYEIVNDSLFFFTINKNRKEVSTVEEFYKDIFEKISNEKVEIFFINESETFINYVAYDEFVNGWIIHLFKKEKPDLDLHDNTILQNDIKSLLSVKLSETLDKFGLLKKIYWKNRSKENEPVILSKKIFLTSLPQGWLSCEHLGTNEDKDLVLFKHELISHSFGTAKRIMSNEVKMKKFALKDIANLQNNKNLNEAENEK